MQLERVAVDLGKESQWGGFLRSQSVGGQWGGFLRSDQSVKIGEHGVVSTIWAGNSVYQEPNSVRHPPSNVVQKPRHSEIGNQVDRLQKNEELMQVSRAASRITCELVVPGRGGVFS